MSKEITYKEKTAAEIIKSQDFFDGSEEFKKPLTKKQFLEQWIGFNFKIQLKEVVDHFEIEPDEVTHGDIIEYIFRVIDDGLWTTPYRPWIKDDQDEEIKEGDLLILDW